MAIIEVNHVTKEYQLGQMQSLKETLLKGIARLQGKKRPEKEKFKALHDINFHIEPGEVVGIIGHNGAGKSTLLKILSQITTPTSGNVKVNGKVAPLIEVGAGLVPDLTGRENILLNATILGISRKEIKAKMDEIIEFAELEEFIDTPIKRYSSGMKVKLGFSIATSLDAEILIVDEVLAVGDLAFQRKCFDRMENLMKRQGKTVLIVGHNIRQLERICSRMIMLEHGKVLLDNNPKSVANLYYEKTNARILNTSKKGTNESSITTSGEVELRDIKILDNNQQTERVFLHKPMQIGLLFDSKTKFEHLDISIGFHTTDFVYISTFSTGAIAKTPVNVGENYIECKILDIPLNPGIYCIRVGFHDESSRAIWLGENLKQFEVTLAEGSRTKLSLQSLVDLKVEWLLPPPN